jgi:gliding motility-associated-like protein
MNKCGPLFLFLAFVCNAAYCQNLVTNPGFEEYNHCPDSRSEITASPGYDTFTTALDWIDPTNTTPDYFNRCGTDSAVRLPYLTLDGYHEPRTGNGCAGFSAFAGDPGDYVTDYYSEYVETRLSSPLIAGHSYYICFYVCLTYHDRSYFNIISVNNIGAILTNDMADTTCNGPVFFMTGNEVVHTPAGFYVTDTAQWTLVSGVYHATGGEQWLTIGRFNPEPFEYIILRTAEKPPYKTHGVCYLLVDDVCAIDMNNPVGTDTSVYAPQFPIMVGDDRPGQYQWLNGDTSQSTQVPDTGAWVRQRWTDCAYFTDTFHVGKIPPENCLWLPSAFTPNNDGLNDGFGPGNTYCGPAFASFDFIIFNRFGQQVFESHNAGDKWNGTYNGHLAETGVYFYMLQYSYGGNYSALNRSAPTAPKVIRGDVTLIR